MAGKRTDLSGLWLAPYVMASRMPIIWFEALNPDPGRRDETNRMISEKVVATQEGIIAAQVALGSAMAENMAAMAFGQKAKATARGTASAMMRASLGPAAKRVRANARRLARGG